MSGYRNKVRIGQWVITLTESAGVKDPDPVVILRIDGSSPVVGTLGHFDLVRLATVLLDAAAEINPDNRRGNG